MSNILYITNLSDAVTEDVLADLFAEYGEIVAVQIDVEARTQMRFALVEMASEKVATKAHRSLNGYLLDEYALSISYPDVHPRELTAKQRKALDNIIERLEETEDVPVRQLTALARLCGLPFVEALTEEALAVEAGPGIMTSDGTRARTKGGVFFYLARYRIAPDVRRVVYNRKGKISEE